MSDGEVTGVSWGGVGCLAWAVLGDVGCLAGAVLGVGQWCWVFG